MWPKQNSSIALLALLALVVPGGSLLLAWTLYRKFLPRMRAWARRCPTLLVVLAAVLQGCATHFDVRAGAAPRFQNLSAAPANAAAFVTPDALQPGDILLSSMPGLTAAGIELMTVAPVSHASLYIGDSQVVEAVRAGVGTRTLDEVMAEETVVLVMRYPGLTAAQARRMREYALARRGAGFNFVGITLQIPYAVARRVCELPLVPGLVRDRCIRGLGVVPQLASRERRFFCSQLVLQAYRHAGVRVTDADPRIVSPADILHMRQGDVPSFVIERPLRYVGHLKYDLPLVAAAPRML